MLPVVLLDEDEDEVEEWFFMFFIVIVSLLVESDLSVVRASCVDDGEMIVKDFTMLSVCTGLRSTCTYS